ncbi:MAG TPA: hypothetical protein VJQ84_06140, partial [Solirubrobacterales bacterium]|nr:hypothetical protein [Solirubrobacterales bacterium]
KTYDLADLASRPLLLALIIDSIVLRGLDLTNSGTQYGPSGLYEIYTRIKLDVDLSKGPTRRRGLSLEARRMLAEALAIKMYKANTLELDFREILTDLLDGSDPDVSNIRESGLSRDEIATDFATCSFITLDRSSACRFVHKSFRGFFVARVLKDHLWKGLHPLFSEWLERDVLYFLGGFAPTQPQVAKNLWAKFSNSSRANRTLRRNLLVAFLYTKPDHDALAISKAEIADADFGRLSFTRTELTDISWLKCKVTDLSIDSAIWKAVRTADSRFGRLSATDSDVQMAIRDTDLESVSFQGTKGDFSTQAVLIGDFKAESSSMHLVLKETALGRLAITESELSCDFSWQDTQLETIKTTRSRLSVACDWLPTLQATHSIVDYKGAQAHVADWGLAESVVVLNADPMTETPNPGVTPLGSGLSGDGRSVVLAPQGIRFSLLESLAAGVFGLLAPTDRHPISEPSDAIWGILAADDWIAGRPELPDKVEGHRIGNVLLVTQSWYDREIAAGGRLALLGKLMELIPAEQPDADTAAIGEMLPHLLSAVRVAYEHIAEATWIESNAPSRTG